MAQLEGSEFDFSDLFVSPAIPSGMFGVVPGYDPSASEFFGPNVQRFIEILRGYFEDQDQDDIDRILRQGEIQKFIEVLRRVESGDATIEELKAVDVSDLAEMPGWSEYYSGVIGEETGTGETDDTEEQDPNLRELIEKYGQEAVDDAQRKLKELEAVFGKVIDDPWGTLEEIISKTASASSGDPCGFTSVPGGTGLPEWVRECVTVGVGIGLPFPLPGPLGSIFKGATVGDIEKAIKEAGHDIGKVLRGEISIEEVMGDIAETVGKKIQGIFKDVSEVSVDDVLGTIGSILVGGGYILAEEIYDKYFKDKVNSTIGVPIIPFTSSQECQDSERYTADAEGNCGECIDSNKIYDATQGKCVDKPEVDSYDCAKEESRKGGTVAGSSECGECLDGFEEDAEGNCIAKDNEIEDNGPTAAECLEENKEHIPGDDVTDSSCGGCLEGYEPNEEGVCVKKETVTQVECPQDSDKPGQMVDDLSECYNAITQVECPEGTDKQGQLVNDLSQCNNAVTQIECPEDTPKAGQMVNNLSECGTKGTTFTVVCGQKEPYVPTGNALAYSQAYSEYEAEYNEKCGTDGNGGNGGETPDPEVDCSQITADNYQECGKVDCFTNGTPGPYVDSFSECPSEGVIKDPEDTTVTYECDDPYATTNPDGSCGACKEGYVFDGGVERCVQENVVTENCQDAAYAAANPEECGSGTTPVTETPDDSSTTSGGGGGGGGGGGRRGMFSTFDYQRTPFVGVQYQSPIRPVRALNVLDSFLQNELKNKNNLFS